VSATKRGARDSDDDTRGGGTHESSIRVNDEKNLVVAKTAGLNGFKAHVELQRVWAASERAHATNATTQHTLEDERENRNVAVVVRQ
jgi:hypothetical protein